MRLKNILFVILLSSLCNFCMAWGADGHKLVAKIAYSQVNAAIKDSLAKYLNGASIEDAAVWMDEIKSDKSYDFQKPWHYVNIDKGVDYKQSDTGNIVWAINHVIGELKERQKYSKEKIAIDLKILIHLLGDLHQPLHCGYARDQGGNTITVYYDAASTNLHRVWDTEIIRDEVLGQNVDWSKLSHFTPEELKRIRKIDIIAWMNESRALLDTVYDFKGDNLSSKYARKNAPIIERQLLVGGLRLAAILKDIFGKA
jgi:hypothetical protein